MTPSRSVLGNGACAQPKGYGALLRLIASHGLFIVAANSREVGSGSERRRGIDFADVANADPTSPCYGHLALTKVRVMGHSQEGGVGTAAAASDPRVDAAILYNGGSNAVQPFLAISGTAAARPRWKSRRLPTWTRSSIIASAP